MTTTNTRPSEREALELLLTEDYSCTHQDRPAGHLCTAPAHAVGPRAVLLDPRASERLGSATRPRLPVQEARRWAELLRYFGARCPYHLVRLEPTERERAREAQRVAAGGWSAGWPSR